MPTCMSLWAVDGPGRERFYLIGKDSFLHTVEDGVQE
jgi:hypothetical protein